MRIIWTLIKVAVGLAIAIPLTLFALAAVAGLVALAVRLAVVALIGYGMYRVARFFFSSSPSTPARPALPAAEPPDPYYTAAMRELDAELGTK